jgi:hypothetical protein
MRIPGLPARRKSTRLHQPLLKKRRHLLQGENLEPRVAPGSVLICSALLPVANDVIELLEADALNYEVGRNSRKAGLAATSLINLDPKSYNPTESAAGGDFAYIHTSHTSLSDSVLNRRSDLLDDLEPFGSVPAAGLASLVVSPPADHLWYPANYPTSRWQTLF